MFCPSPPERIHLHMRVDVQNTFTCFTSYTFRNVTLGLWVLRCGCINNGSGMEDVRVTVPDFGCEVVYLKH
jgi:hypothetical protein